MSYNATAASAKNICHDLSNSRYEGYYNGFIFRFSTQAHADKFNREVWKRKEWLDDSLSRRFYVPLDTGMLAAFQLYQQIEGRGFYVEDMGIPYTSPNDLQLCVVM